METFDSNPALIRKLIGQTSPTGWENRKGIIRKAKTRKVFQTGKQLSKASPVTTSVMTRKLQRIFWQQKNQNSDRQGNRTETGESGKKAQKIFRQRYIQKVIDPKNSSVELNPNACLGRKEKEMGANQAATSGSKPAPV
jgi:hypothetical protein